MKKILVLTLAMAGISAFAEMGIVPINQLIRRGKRGTANAVLVARNVGTNDITRVAGYMAGTEMGANAPIAPVYAEGYFPAYRNDSNNTGLGFELQAWSEPLQKTVSANIFFYEQDGDLYVYLYRFRIRANAVAAQSLYASGSEYEPSTALDGEHPCLCGLRVWIAGRDRVADWSFWKSAGKTIWERVTPQELMDFEGIFTGGYRPYLMHLLGYNVSDSAGVRSVQLQAWQTNGMTRAVHVSLASSGSSVEATMTDARRNEAGGNFLVGRDSSYLSSSQTRVDTEDGNGIAIRGVGARIEKRTSTAKYANYLQTSENRTVVWENVNVADILSINGDMAGGWMGSAGTDRRPYYLTFGDGQVSVQFQAIGDSRLYCVKAVFVQNGANVEGYVEYARYVDLPATGVGLGFDFDSGDSRIGNNKIHTSDSGDGYGGYGLKNVSAMLVPASGSDVFVWKGAAADGYLSHGGNWVGGIAPTSGAKLYFRDPTPGVIVNDYADNTCFEGLYFAGSGSNTVAFTGNAVKVATIDNLSEVAAVHVSAPVVCDANFEPWVGGGMSIDTLNVAGALAPRGNRPLGPLGTANAAVLSGGNVHAWEGGVYGLGGAFVRRTLSGAVNASFDYLDTAGFTREVFEIGGTNTVANRVELPNGQIFAVKNGVTSVPDLGPSGDDPHVNLAVGAQLHIRDYRNQYERAVRFEGAGRVSFGTTGYAASRADIFDGVAFATAGNDYTVAGTPTPGADGTLRFAAVDPDGVGRAITFAPASTTATDVEVLAGTLKATGSALGGVRLLVSGGFYEPVGAAVAVPAVEFSGSGGLSATAETSVELQAGSFTGTPKAYYFSGGSSISIPNETVDLTGATVVFDAEFGTQTDVLSAASIVGTPSKVVSAQTGRKISYSVGEKAGLSVLTVTAMPRGMSLIFR